MSLPLEEERYVLNHQLLWDVIHIRYGWELTRLPKNGIYGVKFGLQHALLCKKVDLLQLDIAKSETLLLPY